MHDLHGNVIEIYKTNQTKPFERYYYNAFGIQYGFDDTDLIEAPNQWGYCDQLYDNFTHDYYMRARYYNPDTGRFISEDIHWNPSNMIYGDRTFEEDETKYPDITASLQANNLYGYCMGNPVKHIDINGEKGIEFALLLLLQAFLGNGGYVDYSKSECLRNTLRNSDILNEEIDKNLAMFKESNMQQKTYNGRSISFYDNDKNLNDFDLHMAIGKADYSMTFTKRVEEKSFLWKHWTETVYDVEITIKDYYNFDEYREGLSLGNVLNNWGFDKQKAKDLTPFYWSATFKFEGVG